MSAFGRAKEVEMAGARPSTKFRMADEPLGQDPDDADYEGYWLDFSLAWTRKKVGLKRLL